MIETINLQSLQIRQTTLDLAKRAFLDDDALSYLQKWPWLHEQARPDNGLKSDQFALLHRVWLPAYADDFDHTWCSEHRHAILQVETAENVAREERQLQKLKAVRPEA